MKKEKNINEIVSEDEAILLIDKGALRKAERILKQMLLSDPKCLPAHFHLARVYRRTKQYRLALYHGRRTIRLNPHEKNACLNLGLIYEVTGNDERASVYYRRELSHNPKSPETLYNIGRLYYNRRRWSQASKYLARCFDTGFMYQIDDTVDKLALCYKNIGDVHSYIVLFTRYLNKFPRTYWAAANLGRALLYVKDYEGAVRWLSRAYRLKAKRDVRLELSRAKRMLKNK